MAITLAQVQNNFVAFQSFVGSGCNVVYYVRTPNDEFYAVTEAEVQALVTLYGESNCLVKKITIEDVNGND